jgi:hypothetical protein
VNCCCYSVSAGSQSLARATGSSRWTASRWGSRQLSAVHHKLVEEGWCCCSCQRCAHMLYLTNLYVLSYTFRCRLALLPLAVSRAVLLLLTLAPPSLLGQQTR